MANENAKAVQAEKENIIEVKKGETLFEEGESSKDLYIIRSGVVKIFKDLDGKSLPIAMVHAGQFVGELSFFDGKPRSATAQAATDVKVIKFDPGALEKELHKLPSWMFILFKTVASRVRDADDLIKRNKIIDKKMKEEFARWK